MFLNIDFLQHFFYFIGSSYSLPLILINFLVTLVYTLRTFLAQKKFLSPSVANLFRLFSLIVSSLLLTLLFAKHGIDTLDQKNSLLVVVGYLSCMNCFYLWLKHFDIRYVLSTQVITTIFFLVLLIFKFDLIIKGASAFSWVLMVYSLALGFTHLLSFDNFSVFRLFHNRLESYAWYKNVMEHTRVDTAMISYVPCGLTINMVNLIYLIQVADGFFAYLLMGVCLWSIGYQTLLAIGLCALCETHPVKYRWNFVIQTYLNLWVTLKTVWQQTLTNSLPRKIPLVNLGMALLLTAIQLPTVGYCAGPEFTSAGASSELASDEGSRDLFGNKNKPTASNKAVGEGQTASKAAKVAKPAVDFAAKEAKDIGGRYYEKGKNAAAGAGVAGTAAVVAYGASEGAKAVGVELTSLPGTSANPSTEEFQKLESQVKELKAEVKELKAQKEQSEGQKEVENEKVSNKK